MREENISSYQHLREMRRKVIAARGDIGVDGLSSPIEQEFPLPPQSERDPR